MKNILLTIILASIAVVMTNAQKTCISYNSEDQTPADEQVWLQHFDPQETISGTGSKDGTQTSGVVRFTKEIIEQHKGKTISAIEIALKYEWDDVTIWIKTGDDISAATTIYTQAAGHLSEGWNHIELDTPVEITGDETINIEYGGISFNTGIGMTTETKAEKGCSYLCMRGKYYDMADFRWGNIMIRALVEDKEEEGETDTDEYGLVWMKHFNPDEAISGTGSKDGTQSSGVARFSKETIEKYKGKSISAVAIALRYNWDNVTIWVKTGDDIKTATTIYSQEAAHLCNGWNYIKLDTPVEITGEEAINIEYGGVSYNTGIGMTTESKAEKGCSYLCMRGIYYDMADFGWGNIMVKALVDGDVDKLASCVSARSIQGIGEYTPQNSTLQAEIVMVNNSFAEVSEVEISYSVNGEEKYATATFDEAVKPYTDFSYTIPVDIPDKDTDLSFTISKVNGQQNILARTEEKHISTYNPEDIAGRTLLIEKFTGQECSICPLGEEYIKKAVTGFGNNVARIDHHYGFLPDLFTIEESGKIGSFFNVRSAPQCMIDRRTQKDMDYVTFHPANITGSLIFEELQKPADVTVNIETVYDAATRKLSATVKGEGKTDLEGKRINVVLTQSGYVAYQNEGGEDYVHNDFPIEYLTEYDGDALSVNSDGTYEMTFECQIPEAYTNEKGTREVDLEQLKVVAFISDWNDCNSSEVMNAAVVKVETKGNVDITPATTPSFTVRGGRVVAEAECQSLRVYSLNGMEVENDRLPEGIYIVKAICNGDTYTGKVAVR